MANFMIAYYGGDKPSTKEEGIAHMGKWMGWVKGLGETVVTPATPMMNSKLVTSDNVQDDTDPKAMNGYLVVKADNIDAAIEIAKSDPFLNMNGTIRVSQMMEMN